MKNYYTGILLGAILGSVITVYVINEGKATHKKKPYQLIARSVNSDHFAGSAQLGKIIRKQDILSATCCQ